jgi:hypothetical protein
MGKSTIRSKSTIMAYATTVLKLEPCSISLKLEKLSEDGARL